MERETLEVASEAAKELGIPALVATAYEDVLQPAAREIGRQLVVAAKAVGVALLPIEGLVWGYEQTKAFVAASVAAKLARRSPHQIQSPDKIIAGPLLMNLAFAADAPHLKELYANLLANAMHASTANRVHPSFVQVIQQLAPAEAKILKVIAQKWAGPDVLFREHVASFAPPMFLDIETRRYLPKDQDPRISSEWIKLCAACDVSDTDLAQAFLRNLLRLGILSECLVRLRHKGSLYELLSSAEHDPESELTREIVITEYGNIFLNLCVRDEPLIRSTCRAT